MNRQIKLYCEFKQKNAVFFEVWPWPVKKNKNPSFNLYHSGSFKVLTVIAGFYQIHIETT